MNGFNTKERKWLQKDKKQSNYKVSVFIIFISPEKIKIEAQKLLQVAWKWTGIQIIIIKAVYYKSNRLVKDLHIKSQTQSPKNYKYLRIIINLGKYQKLKKRRSTKNIYSKLNLWKLVSNKSVFKFVNSQNPSIS